MRLHILGNGVMASALALGLRDKFELTIVGREAKNLAKFDSFGIDKETYGQRYDIGDKNIILAVKPYALESVSSMLTGKAKICISLLYGVDTARLNSAINSGLYARAMPNIAAEFKRSVTPYFTQSDSEIFKSIISSFGEAVRVGSEREFDVAGALSGCAPAFIALVASALVEGGVYNGLNAKTSAKIINSMLLSTAALISKTDPQNLIEQISTPAGSTIKGIRELEKNAVRAAFIDALIASCPKRDN